MLGIGYDGLNFEAMKVIAEDKHSKFLHVVDGRLIIHESTIIITKEMLNLL